MSCYVYVETPPPALLNICKNPTKPLPIQSTEFGPFDSLTDFPEFLSMIAATCQSTVNNLPAPSLKWKFDSEYIEGTWGEAMQGGRNDEGNEYHAMISSMTGIGQTNILKEMVAGEQTAKEESQARITTPVAHFLHVGLKLQARKCVILMNVPALRSGDKNLVVVGTLMVEQWDETGEGQKVMI
ncbi:hypothetical protein B0H14DRAFT_2641409 [Mycena olivaceomarginata]|nr:hypothetical protein B0H14DRAFT_2641409 [Mycena olivaceomarginata]